MIRAIQIFRVSSSLLFGEVWRAIISLSFRQKLSVSYGLFYDGWPILCGHWLSAYAYENHELIFFDAYGADRFFFCLAYY